MEWCGIEYDTEWIPQGTNVNSRIESSVNQRVGELNNFDIEFIFEGLRAIPPISFSGPREELSKVNPRVQTRCTSSVEEHYPHEITTGK